MFAIPRALLLDYESRLIRHNIPPHQRAGFHKWLRYYFDYCINQNLPTDNPDSLTRFDQKLAERQQAEENRRLARSAIAIYLRSKDALPVTTPLTQPHDNTAPVVLIRQDWQTVYKGLEDGIKIRHYSKKTWQAYRHWARLFQAFTKSKAPDNLDMQDVKAFLSFLAVERGVAATTQNQAFNAILFLFKNVLNKEFTITDGVVRAKHRPYVPVVLSRTEVDRIFSYLEHPYRLIDICKLHGSVNWRLGEVPDYLKSEVDLEWEPFGFTKGMMDVEMYSSNKLLHKPNWLEGFRNSEVDPFLVLPGYGKAFDVRANAAFWYKPEFFFATTQDVYIIGLSLAPDDFFIRSFFLANLPAISSSSSYGSKTIHIINPSEEVFENFAFIAKSPSCKIHKECFSEKHIKLMQGCSA